MRQMQDIHPGAAGVSYQAAGRLLDALQRTDTEPHAILAARHGQVFLEGYWAPYGKGVIHGCQSLTKTVTGIGLGAAMQEGILGLDDRLVDLFPEYKAHTSGRPFWDELRVRHIATMSAGMDRQPEVTAPDWMEDFFRTEITHQPGTAFFYNSIACSMVGACIRRKSGSGLKEYLSDRIFRKLGIDPDRLLWHRHADGLENGSGGLISTVHDNALLMELYRCRGIWHGERLLSEEWVDFALQIQNPHTGGDAAYGGMMWVRDGYFMADGAMGQWAMLFPEKDMVVSIQQTIASPEAAGRVRDAIRDFVEAAQDTPVPWSREENDTLENRLRTLCIPAPVCEENRGMLRSLSGKRLRIVEGQARFFADDLAIFNKAYEAPVRLFGFEEDNGDLLLTVTADKGTVICPVAFKGYRPVCNLKPVSSNPVRMASVTGSFPDGDSMCLEVRWLESCRIHHLLFRFDGEGAEIITSRVPVGGFDVPDERARALWVTGEI